MKDKGNIIRGLLFLGVGLFIFLNPDALVKFVSYFIGGVLMVYGLYKTVNYYIQDKRNGIVNQNELGFGITMVILGILLICLAGTIEFLLRLIIGAYLIMAGLTKIMGTFYTTDRSTMFYSWIVMGLLFISAGLYTIINANLSMQILGLFLMIYGIMDFVGFFLYKDDKVKVRVNEVQEAELIEEKKD